MVKTKKELTKKRFEWNFLKEHGFELTQSNFDQIEDIIYDWGTKEEKKQYSKYFKKLKEVRNSSQA